MLENIRMSLYKARLYLEAHAPMISINDVCYASEGGTGLAHNMWIGISDDGNTVLLGIYDGWPDNGIGRELYAMVQSRIAVIETDNPDVVIHEHYLNIEKIIKRGNASKKTM